VVFTKKIWIRVTSSAKLLRALPTFVILEAKGSKISFGSSAKCLRSSALRAKDDEIL
jgi:hypothetical protein